MKKSFVAFALLLCALIVVIGCGRKVTKTEGVTGKVTLNGEPLAGATVFFVALDKNSGALDSFARTGEDGTYKLQTLTGAANAGTTPGKYAVKFDAQEQYDTGKTQMVNGEEVPVMDSRSLLPKKYNDEKTAGFEVEVVKGANEFNFDLEK